MYCSNCGQPIGENAYVCIHCGVLLEKKSKSQPVVHKTNLTNNKVFWIGFADILAIGIQAMFFVLAVLSSQVYVQTSSYTYSSRYTWDPDITFLVVSMAFAACAAVLGSLSIAFGVTDHKKEKCSSSTLMFSIAVFAVSVVALVIGILSITIS